MTRMWSLKEGRGEWFWFGVKGWRGGEITQEALHSHHTARGASSGSLWSHTQPMTWRRYISLHYSMHKPQPVYMIQPPCSARFRGKKNSLKSDFLSPKVARSFLSDMCEKCFMKGGEWMWAGGDTVLIICNMQWRFVCIQSWTKRGPRLPQGARRLQVHHVELSMEINASLFDGSASTLKLIKSWNNNGASRQKLHYYRLVETHLDPPPPILGSDYR